MEFWDVYDETGQPTGKKIEKGESLSPLQYHLAIEAWIVRPDGSLLVQQRSESCEILPGVLAMTTGRAIAGETSLECCIREIKEELGIDVRPENAVRLMRINRRDATRIIWDVYLVFADFTLADVKLQESEVADVRLVSLTDFQALMEDARFFTYPEMPEVLEALRKSLP